MIPMTPAEREKLKRILSVVYSEDVNALRADFNRISARAATHPGDHQSAVLGLYAGVLKEVLAQVDANTAPAKPKLAPGAQKLIEKYTKK